MSDPHEFEEFDEEESAAAREFMHLRAHAIGAYGNLEQMMCDALAFLGEMPPSTAGTIFFRISNVRYALEILDKLKKKKVGVQHSGFWNSLIDRGKRLADRRNEIVHWATTIDTDRQGKVVAMGLMSPNYWGWDNDSPNRTSTDIDAFARECLFQTYAMKAFILYHSGKMAIERRDTWREILQQPSVYPPPPDHPLSQKPTGQPLLRKGPLR